MNVLDLCARVAEFLAVVELTDAGEVVVREYSEHRVPPELLATCREHKAELAAWLTWERDAAALWRAVFDRIAATGDHADLATDSKYLRLEAIADAAHARHDRAGLVDALLRLETYGTTTQTRTAHDQNGGAT